MQHPEGAAFMVSMAKRARKHRLGLQFITQDVQVLLSEDTSRAITGHSGRALLQNASFKLLLQQDVAAISTVGDVFDLPQDLQRWLLSCPKEETACCWPGATASPYASRPPLRRQRPSNGDREGTEYSIDRGA